MTIIDDLIDDLLNYLRAPQFVVAAQNAIESSSRGMTSTLAIAPRRLWSFFGGALKAVAGFGSLLMDLGNVIVDVGFKIGIYGFVAWSGARLIQYLVKPFAQTAALRAATLATA